MTHAWSDKAFKGTVVNQALPSLHEGSHEITLTVPLIEVLIIHYVLENCVCLIPLPVIPDIPLQAFLL